MSEEHDYIGNDQLDIPEEVADFGDLLRTLRNNHGYSIPKLSKMISIPTSTIAAIEKSTADLPPENILRLWLNRLGCGRINTQKIIHLSRQFRVKHWVTLVRKESSNPDLLRLLRVYKEGKLSDYDRLLMRLIGRS